MFKNLAIKTRLVFLLLLLGTELVVGAAVGLVSLGKANEDMSSMYDDRLVCLGQLDQVVRALEQSQLALASAVSAESAEVPGLLAEVQRNSAVVDEQWKAYLGTEITPEERVLADRFAKARAEFIDQGVNPAAAALRAGDLQRASQVAHGPLLKLFGPVRDQVNALIKLQLDEAARLHARSESAYRWVRVLCLSGLALGLAVAAVVGTLLIRGIVRPLEQAVDLAHAVAAGDLTREIEVRSKDETGRLMQALKDMNAGLVRIVGQVRGGTDIIATASGQIAAGNLDLSSRTEEQASALEETASSMEELTSTVKQNAENARQANVLAMSASEVAGKGGAVVSEVVSTMANINASSKKIVDIIAVIDGIAFQTNILALNAAVEAARAGEQGRGFAVVAGEVRTLAQRSAAAAKEIKALIDDSVEQVQVGSQLVDRAGATMAEIVNSVSRVTDIMAEISAASREQTAGIEQVNVAINEMDQATQQNAALVEEASAAAQSLRDEADHLARAVATFRINDAPPASGRALTVNAALRSERAPRPAPARRAAAEEAWEAF